MFQDLTFKPDAPPEISVEPDGTTELYFAELHLTLLLTTEVARQTSLLYWKARAQAHQDEAHEQRFHAEPGH